MCSTVEQHHVSVALRDLYNPKYAAFPDAEETFEIEVARLNSLVAREGAAIRELHQSRAESGRRRRLVSRA